ncbi:MAG: hypothetical protein ACK551_07355 [Vampirovibrionales bacterium]
MFLSPIGHQSFTPQQQRVGNSDVPIAERWLKILLEEACEEGCTIDFITDSTWRFTLLDALQSALQSRDGDFNALNRSILELDRQLAEKYGVKSVLQHILNPSPDA